MRNLSLFWHLFPLCMCIHRLLFLFPFPFFFFLFSFYLSLSLSLSFFSSFSLFHLIFSFRFLFSIWFFSLSLFRFLISLFCVLFIFVVLFDIIFSFFLFYLWSLLLLLRVSISDAICLFILLSFVDIQSRNTAGSISINMPSTHWMKSIFVSPGLVSIKTAAWRRWIYFIWSFFFFFCCWFVWVERKKVETRWGRWIDGTTDETEMKPGVGSQHEIDAWNEEWKIGVKTDASLTDADVGRKGHCHVTRDNSINVINRQTKQR